MPDAPPKLLFSATRVVKACRELSWGAKAVWLEDWILDCGPEGAWISGPNLGARLGMTKQNVDQHRQELRARGLHLVIERPGARTNGWRAILPASCIPPVRPTVEQVTTCAAQLDREIVAAQAQPPMSRNGRAWTYFLAAADGAIKIGTADDPEARLRELQTAHHEPLRLLGQTAAVSEREAHRQWAALHVRGEWFRPDPALLGWIAYVLARQSPLSNTPVDTASAVVQAMTSPLDQSRADGGVGGASNLDRGRETTLQPAVDSEDGEVARATEGRSTAEDGGARARSPQGVPPQDRHEVPDEARRDAPRKARREGLDPAMAALVAKWEAKAR